jgi:release factor glutamine methyltransferase
MHDHRTYHWVGARSSQAQKRKVETTLHIFFMFHHLAKVAFMLLCCMKTVKDVFIEFKKELKDLYAAEEIEAITLLAVKDLSGFSKAKLKAFPELELTEQQYKKLSEILNELKPGKPIQYILGKTEFYGMPFKVNPSVLIPRPETEELVEWVISVVRSRQLAVGNLLDIGTGSGCIAIALKKNLLGFEVVATDISSAALRTARDNAVINNVDICFIEADILHNNSSVAGNYSLIVSNPPYVTALDKTQMHANVIDFEPHTALFVPEDDPLVFYKAIAEFASKNLRESGLLFFEINENYGEQLVKLLIDKSFNNIELRKDLAGRDRMVRAEIVAADSSSGS